MNSCGGSLWIRGIGKRSTQGRMRAFTLSGKVFSSYLYRHAFASILSWPSIFPSAGIFGHGQLRRAAPRIGTTFDSADSAARIPRSRAFHSPVASPPRRCEGLRLVHAGVVSDHDLAVPIGYLGYGAQVRAHRAAQVVKDPMWYRAGQLVDALLRLECKSVLRLKDNPYVDACVHLLRRAIPGQLCQARQ
jgi:hypothetical protein